MTKEININQAYTLIKDKGNCTIRMNKEIGGCPNCFMHVRCTHIVDNRRHQSMEDFFQMIYNDALKLVQVLIVEGKLSESDVFEAML